jgi:hypothetical protein
MTAAEALRAARAAGITMRLEVLARNKPGILHCECWTKWCSVRRAEAVAAFDLIGVRPR